MALTIEWEGAISPFMKAFASPLAIDRLTESLTESLSCCFAPNGFTVVFNPPRNPRGPNGPARTAPTSFGVVNTVQSVLDKVYTMLELFVRSRGTLEPSTWLLNGHWAKGNVESFISVRRLESSTDDFLCRIYREFPSPCRRFCEILDGNDEPHIQNRDFASYDSLQGVVWHFPQRNSTQVRCYNTITMKKLSRQFVNHPHCTSVWLTEMQDPYTMETVPEMFIQCCLLPNQQFDDLMATQTRKKRTIRKKRSRRRHP